MELEALQKHFDYLDKLLLRGREFMAALKAHIEKEERPHRLTTSSATEYCILATFYECKLSFRVEVPWADADMLGKVIAKVWCREEIEESKWPVLGACEFDVSGNVIVQNAPTGQVAQDFSEQFLSAVLTELAKKRWILRPH